MMETKEVTLAELELKTLLLQKKSADQFGENGER